MARTTPAARITTLWARLSGKPGGSWLFSRMLGLMVPYSGSIGAHVRQLRPGYARVTMRDRRSVQNHLHSIHAIALANLGEVTSGLALITAAPSEARTILVGLSVVYLKKARGELQAECSCQAGPVSDTVEQDVESRITNADGEVVARVTARWRLSPPQ